MRNRLDFRDWFLCYNRTYGLTKWTFSWEIVSSLEDIWLDKGTIPSTLPLDHSCTPKLARFPNEIHYDYRIACQCTFNAFTLIYRVGTKKKQPNPNNPSKYLKTSTALRVFFYTFFKEFFIINHLVDYANLILNISRHIKNMNPMLSSCLYW